jgi:hypothetical protein
MRIPCIDSNDDIFLTEIQETISNQKCCICHNHARNFCAYCLQYICQTHATDIGNRFYSAVLCPLCDSNNDGQAVLQKLGLSQ